MGLAIGVSSNSAVSSPDVNIGVFFLLEEYQELKKKIGELESRMAELMQKAQAILAQILSALSSGKPSPSQISKILGQLDAICDQADQIYSEINADCAQMKVVTEAIRNDESHLSGPQLQLLNSETKPAKTIERAESLRKMLEEIKLVLAKMAASQPKNLSTQ